MATLSRDQYSIHAQDELAHNIYVDNWAGQTFTPSVTGNLNKISFCVKKGNTTSTDLEVAIRATSGGQPTGADLALETIAFGGLSTSNLVRLDVTFSSPVALTSGVMYAVVIRSSGGTIAGPFYRVYTSTSGSAYSGGNFVRSSDGGSSWFTDTTRDLAFVTEMSTAVATPGIDRFAFGGRFGSGADRVEDTGIVYRAQTFTPSVTAQIDSVLVRIDRRNGQVGGSVTFEIQGVDGSFKPDGVAISSVTTILDTALPNLTDNNPVIATFTTKPTLTSGTQYALVIKFLNVVAGSATYNVHHTASTDQYSGGQHWISLDSGATYNANASAQDIAFATFMLEPTVTSQTILSDATVEITTEQTIFSDAFHGAITSQTILSDATVFIESEQNILSDAFHGQETSQTIFSDASIGVIQTVTIFSDAFVGQETNQTIFSDAIVFITTEETILSAATILVTSLQTILSSANISASVVQTINANASVAMTTTQTITGGAVITVREPVLKLYVVT